MRHKLIAVKKNFNSSLSCKHNSWLLTFFWRSLIANFNRFRCMRSPCSYIGPVGSWFSITSSSLEVRVWSSSAVAKSWHWRRNSWYSFLCAIVFYLLQTFGKMDTEKDWLTLNSCSKKLRRRSSHDSSNAVRMGSLDERAIKLGLASAR